MQDKLGTVQPVKIIATKGSWGPGVHRGERIRKAKGEFFNRWCERNHKGYSSTREVNERKKLKSFDTKPSADLSMSRKKKSAAHKI